MRDRTFILAGLLLAVIGTALALASSQVPVSQLPSARNPGPQGLRALALYLAETGRDADVNTAPWTELRGGTLIIAEPLVEEPSDAEVKALVSFVEGGGTAILLHDQADTVSRNLEAAFGAGGFVAGERQPTVSEVLREGPLGGVSVKPALPGWLAGVREVRVEAPGSALLEGGAALLADGLTPFALAARRGQGWIVALARPDPFQNRYVDQGDDLAFDAAALSLAPGPVLFEERHLHLTPRDVPIRGLWATLAQLAAVAGALALARGPRLGSPRPIRHRTGRSSLEYVAQLGGLYRHARVESELARELHPELRRFFHERLQLSTTLDDAAVDEVLAARGLVVPGAFAELAARLHAAGQGLSPAGWARLARDAAELRRAIEAGRQGSSSSSGTEASSS